MPFICVKTNVSVHDEDADLIKRQLGRAITLIPGKTEDRLMVGIEPEYKLWFAGSSEAAAMVEVSLYGGAPSGVLTVFTDQVTKLLSDTLGIMPDRIYVKYSETAHWGWNGSNF